MSRLGKVPVDIPSGVEVKLDANEISVKGPKGNLFVSKHPKIKYEQEGASILISRNDETIVAREQHGLRRTLLNNAVIGVSKGYSKQLEIIGVGYKVSVQGKVVVLNAGFSHPVNFDLPQGIEAKAEGNKLTISGIDKQVVGEVAAQIRKVRPPEPYKGKGIKYVDEQIRRKAGKSGAK